MSDQAGETQGKKIGGFIWLFYFLLASAVFSSDQIIKSIVACHFLPGRGFAVIKNIFHITLVQNTGIAFGLLRNKTNLPLLFFILGTLIFLSLFFRKNNYFWQGRTALSLIVGGALSNLADRIRLGYVVDYLDFRIWPVFNLADTAITIGIGLLCWELFGRRRKKLSLGSNELENSKSQIPNPK